jgi:hypothetical protein
MQGGFAVPAFCGDCLPIDILVASWPVLACRSKLLLRSKGGGKMPISFSTIVLSSQMVVAVADGVPNFDITRSCKLDVAATTGLSVDQSLKGCVNDEQKAKRQLAGQWSKFPAPSRAS